jgi:amino-acid N-acetyltransferase
MRDNLTIDGASSKDLKSVVNLLELVDLPIEGVVDNINNFRIGKISPDQITMPPIVGCVGFEIYGELGVLRSLAVHPDYQKRGIGQALISDGLKFAKRNGMKTLYLLTDTARDYLVSLGFQETSRDAVPQKILDTIEFSSLCPSTSTCLSMSLE